MLKKQMRNTTFACLESDLIDDFPPLVIGGFDIRNHSICEVMENTNKTVIAIYKLHDYQWYRYDLENAYPAYPNYPQPQPLVQSISLGLVVPPIPTISDPTTLVVYVDPTFISESLVIPTIPTITESTLLE